MNQSEFLKLEYENLRLEIRHVRARLFKLAALGVLLLPTAQLAVETLKFQPLMYFVPFLVVALALLYLAESRALMRLGSYIKLEIEHRIRRESDEENGFQGWEHWLSDQRKQHRRLFGDKRLVDKLLAYYFYAIFMIYHLIASLLAVEDLKASYPAWNPVATGAYAFFGLFLIWALAMNFKASVDTLPAES